MKSYRILAALGIGATALLPIPAQAADIDRMQIEKQVIADFKTKNGGDRWEVEDDVVMGGRSEGNFTIDQHGHGVFFGRVSLENNGGFSSIQCNFDAVDISDYDTAYIRLKGDGKSYQFRVKSSQRERPSYIHQFETTGDWQTVEVPLRNMYPSFHGRRLDIPNYPGQTMSQLRLLIGNGREESFKLKIEKIWLR